MQMSMADERIERDRFESQAEEGSTDRKKRGKRANNEGASNKKQRSKGVKMLLWALRKSIVPLMMIIMLVTGLYVGYVVVGKQPDGDVFHWSTWQHLYDLIFAES